MKTKDTLSSCLDSKEQQMQQMQDKVKGSCMVSFRLLNSHLKVLSNNDLKGIQTERGFKWAFAKLFDQDVQTFTGIIFLNVDQLEKQLDKEEFQENGSMAAFSYFLAYTQIEVQQFHDTLIQHMESVKKSIDERALNKREYDIRVNERQMQTKEGKVDTRKSLDVSLVVTKSRQQHTEKPEFNNEGEVDQNAEQCHDKRPLTASLTDIQEYSFVKPYHVLASSESRNSSKNMPRFSSNDIVHNHYLEEAKKKTQERGRNSRPSAMPSAKFIRTANGSKPKPRINNHKSRNWHASKTSCVTTKIAPIAEHSTNSRSFSDFKHFVCSTCQKCVFNANHDVCVTKFLNEVNSCAKVPSHKITNRNKPVEKISIAKKPERQIPTRHRFSIKKTTTVHEKTMTPKSGLTWKPKGRIFTYVGLRWISTRRLLKLAST
ncbi:hypothetical protein Tco_0960787 [Tanacetum coccineum]